jgi:O-antigen/teichoic acid export membrane protein
MFPGYLVTHALIALDLQYLFMYVMLISAATNILLNFYMIPAFGIKGAAWATVFSDFLLTTVCGYLLFRIHQRSSCGSV